MQGGWRYRRGDSAASAQRLRTGRVRKAPRAIVKVGVKIGWFGCILGHQVGNGLNFYIAGAVIYLQLWLFKNWKISKLYFGRENKNIGMGKFYYNGIHKPNWNVVFRIYQVSIIIFFGSFTQRFGTRESWCFRIEKITIHALLRQPTLIFFTLVYFMYKGVHSFVFIYSYV